MSQITQIRTKAFRPDATRSGMLGAPQREDPLVQYSHESATQDEVGVDSRNPPETGEISSSDTDSSSSEDSAGSGIEQNDPHVAPRAWDPDLTMYRNIKSKVVHVVAEGGASSFSCGLRITSNYEHIEASAFLELRKCKRCALAKPIKTVGQFASALKKLRLGA